MKGPFNITDDNLTIVYSDNKNFNNLWSGFLKGYERYSYKYVIDIIEYYLLISNKAINRSFLIQNHEEVLAICPLIIEKVKEYSQGSIYGGKDFLPIALFNKKLTSKQKKHIEDILFKEVKNNFSKFQVKKAFFQADCISVSLKDIYDTFLDKEKALDVSTIHHIIDLTLDEDQLWKQIRHSSKAIINKGLKLFDFKVFDSLNFIDELGETHRKMHHALAGKVTRPIESFKKMSDWVKKGCAIFIQQSFENQVAQLIYVAIGGKSASGASVVENLNIKTPIPMTHSLNFYIYNEVKKRGVEYYDVGLTSYRSSLFNHLSKKEMDINHFKRGFGERNYPLRLWVWFEDLAEEILFIKERLEFYEKNQIK